MLDPEAGQHPHQVLGGEVAGGRLGVGAAAEAAGAGVEGGDARLQRGEGVGERLAVGVVEVHGEPVGADAGVGEGRDERRDVAGGGDADGVAEAELVAPRSSSRVPAVTTCSIGTAPSQGSPKHIET